MQEKRGVARCAGTFAENSCSLTVWCTGYDCAFCWEAAQ